MDIETVKAEVSELAFGYLMAGQLSKDWLGDQVVPDGLPERYRQYDALVDLHVTIHPEVASFVQNLRPKLRGVKTETRREKHRSRDEIEGRIDWPETRRRRNHEAPGDQTLFVTDRRTEAYDIPENLVLKKLLSIVHRSLRQLEDVDFEWVQKSWASGEGEADEIREFRSMYRRNVHLNRIPTPTGSRPTERSIRRAASARQPMYRDAARLLEWRNQLQKGRQRAIRALFDSTIVEPAQHRLFELFVLFRVLDALEGHFEERSRIGPVSKGANRIAALGEPPCYLYHDSSVPDRDITFSTRVPESTSVVERSVEASQSDREWSHRSRDVGNWTEAIRSQYHGSSGGGRPDAIVLQPGEGSADPVGAGLIVEVKHSSRSTKVDEGIADLLRYIAYATDGEHGDFVFPRTDSGDAFGDHVHGLLVIDDVEGRSSVDIDGPIEIVQASNLERRLPGIVRRALDTR